SRALHDENAYTYSWIKTIAPNSSARSSSLVRTRNWRIDSLPLSTRTEDLSIEFFYASLFTFSKRTHAFGVGIDVSLNGITRISSRRIVHNRPRIRFDFSLAGPAPRPAPTEDFQILGRKIRCSSRSRASARPHRSRWGSLLVGPG